MPWLVLDTLGIEPWQALGLLFIIFFGVPLAFVASAALVMSRLVRSRKLGFLLGALWVVGISLIIGLSATDDWPRIAVGFALAAASVIWIWWQFRQRDPDPDES